MQNDGCRYQPTTYNMLPPGHQRSIRIWSTICILSENGLTLLVADWDLTKRKGGHDWYGVVVGNVCLGQPDAKLEVMPWRFCYWTFTIAIRD